MKKKIIRWGLAILAAASLIYIVKINTDQGAETTESANKIRFEVTSDPKTDLRALLDQSSKRYLRELLTIDDPYDGVWTYVLPYYTPTDKDLDAIVDAYWQKYLKNWTDYKVSRYQSEIRGYYRYDITYNWTKPDMSLLNQRINERENVLKSEFGDDYKRLYQTIVSEIPDMIEKLELGSDIEEVDSDYILWTKDKDDKAKGDVYLDDYDADENPFKPLLDPLGELKP